MPVAEMPAARSSPVRATTRRVQIVSWIESVRAALALWRDRMRYRRELARMSERELSDIGVSRSQIAGEINKPFWRA
jgi:uncharacterized protein YjiS (DUF1127 family)